MTAVEKKYAERRESPRLELPGVAAEVASLGGMRAKVLDIGFGGVSIECEREFRVGEVHTLRALTSNSDAAAPRVRARHCRRVTSAGRRPLYVTGFEFVDPWCPGDFSPADEFISQVTKGLNDQS
jgi:hypothetical protein